MLHYWWSTKSGEHLCTCHHVLDGRTLRIFSHFSLTYSTFFLTILTPSNFDVFAVPFPPTQSLSSPRLFLLLCFFGGGSYNDPVVILLCCWQGFVQRPCHCVFSSAGVRTMTLS
ncbi:uncharacterized protein EV420DRAFT_1140200 [Desarmillaria tabescens]|uniref:Uncharacterized protein n=1 Tax=Armillaria tabescens TaxID=1929756 RepID=A0AA39NC54_ARMTA|nr:uncharacterized protein EV420DRAFT_1140200 [Desarmillaria tabescens]KAK0462829.1 hypothetical protein EV420DRAFT_1140200 [Desarmillaria tabescens]